jgi:hypothetical protein
MLSLGRSSVDITPPVGIPLGGWPFERRGERVHRPLTCRALVLRDDIQEVVIVTLDLLGTSTELADAIRGAVTEATGVPATKVLLASSHTHSGPIMPPCLMRGLPPPDEHYLAALAASAAEIERSTSTDRTPVTSLSSLRRSGATFPETTFKRRRTR